MAIEINITDLVTYVCACRVITWFIYMLITTRFA